MPDFFSAIPSVDLDVEVSWTTKEAFFALHDKESGQSMISIVIHEIISEGI